MSKSRNRGTVRILLLGEPSVGKTTLVLSLVSEEFSSKVPARADEITIPADVTPERVPTEIVDFSARTQSNEQLIDEVHRATVICLVYALDNDISIQRLPSHWLPFVRSCLDSQAPRVPVVLVGNKLDLVPNSKMEQVLPLMEQFPEIETCIECSAKTMRNLSEAFWFAQKAVLYPTVPLYQADKKELTVECTRALTRIFRICDIDNDGYLSDKELEAFQERCFAIPLTAQSLHDVKQLVRNSTPGGVTLHGITLKGFLFLHLVFIRKGRHETTWAVLRQFGYDNQLRLSNEFLYPKLTVPQGCSTELSPIGLHFLQHLFSKHDLNGDDCLSPNEVAELLATCPEETQAMVGGIEEFGVCVETNQRGWITRNGFIAHWILTALLEPSRALEYLAYLGFTYQTGFCYLLGGVSEAGPNGGVVGFEETSVASGGLSPQSNRSALPGSLAGCLTSEADFLLRGLTVTGEKRVDYIRRQTNRTVFYARVYGARKVGKTCLMQGLLGRSLRGVGAGTGIGGVAGRTSNWVAATGVPVYAQLRSLVLQEINATQGEQMTAGEALSADVACLVYDVTDPDSFRYVANIFLNFYRGTRVPCLFVAAKSDQAAVLQNYRLDPQEFTAKYRLADIVSFSSFDVLPRSAVSDSDNNNRRRRRSSAETVRSRPQSSSGTSRYSWYLDNDVSTATKTSTDTDAFVNSDGGLLPPENGGGASRLLVETSSDMRSSTPCFQSSTGRFGKNLLVRDASEETPFAPVYIKLAIMANYPHMRHLELAQPDYAWKLTLAATVLAGFGFVAFRIVRPHF